MISVNFEVGLLTKVTGFGKDPKSDDIIKRMKNNEQVSDDERAHIASKFLKKTATAGVVGGLVGAGIAKYINKLRDKDNTNKQIDMLHNKVKDYKGSSKEEIENDMWDTIKKGTSSASKLYDKIM